MIGKTFAHYRITEKLGAGGMGEVWRAHDSKLGRDVALKVVPAAFAQDPERMARFQREAQVLASLNHPHIGAIYGLENLDGSGALVLELIEGPTLSDRVRTGGGVPVAEALRIALQIAEAVETAHERGIIHRDLKPANVKLTADGQVKVLDFGLAKAMEGGDSGSGGAVLTQSPTLSPITGAMTADNVILGTAGYMSPEQARGQSVDKRADIWAFGVILFEMLTGRSLFTGDTVSDSLAAVLRADPDWEQLPAETPPRIRRLLRRCLERDPKNRLRDMGDARLAIAETIAGVPDTVDSGVRVAAAPRSPWPVVVAAVAGAVVAAAALGWLVPRGEELPLRKSAMTMDRDDPSLGAAFEPALSPDGSRLAYVSGGSLRIRSLAELRARELPGTEGARAPFWSPDGRWIGYGVDHELRRIPADGGESQLIGVMPSSSLSTSATACWTADQGIVFSTAMSGLYQIPAQGGDAVELVPTGEGETDFHEVVAGPDGRGLVFIVHRTEGIDTIGALTPDGRRTTLLTVAGQTVADPACSPTGHVLFRRYPSADGVWALPVSFSDMTVTGDPFLVAAGARHPAAAGRNLVMVTGVAAGRRELVWMNRQGETLGAIGEAAVLSSWPSLSPDGTRVVVQEGEPDNRDLWIRDVVRGGRTRVTFTATTQKDYAGWDPAGESLFYFDDFSTFGLYTVRADGSGQPRRIGTGLGPFCSADGKTLYFARKKKDAWDFDVWRQPVDGDSSDAEPLLETPALEWWTPPSPDGRYLLYMSDESGDDEVYATALPDFRGRWQVSTNGGAWPRWRADGAELYYAVGDSVMAVDVDTSGGLRLSTPRLLFRQPEVPPGDWPNAFDVTADGERFVVLRPVRDERARPEIVVVQNWLREFDEGR